MRFFAPASRRREQIGAGHDGRNDEPEQREQRRGDVAQASFAVEPAHRLRRDEHQRDGIRRVRGERVAVGVDLLFGVAVVGGDGEDPARVDHGLLQPPERDVQRLDRRNRRVPHVLERFADNEEVGGSSPPRPTTMCSSKRYVRLASLLALIAVVAAVVRS